MDRALLIPRAALLLPALLLPTACLFDDPLQELDPAAFEDGSLDTLPASGSFRVARTHLLESFGHYGCASCPDAESRLSAYLHAAPGTPAHSPDLIVVNYHVAFPATLADPWITPGTQARYDQFGFTTLPQVKLNGSNAPYGIREKDARFAQGEYDSLIRRRVRVDSLAWLDLSVDTSWYDSAARRLTARISALNRSASPRGGLAVHALAVKNASVTLALLPNHPWEVIVAEAVDRDSTGQLMTLSGMPGLRKKSWMVRMSLGPESERSPAPSNPENPADYAIVVFARDPKGIVENAAARGYEPQ